MKWKSCPTSAPQKQRQKKRNTKKTEHTPREGERGVGGEWNTKNTLQQAGSKSYRPNDTPSFPLLPSLLPPLLLLSSSVRVGVSVSFSVSACDSFWRVCKWAQAQVLEALLATPSPAPTPPGPRSLAAATMINIVLNDKQAKMCQGNNKPAKLIAFNRKARAKLPNKGRHKGGRKGGGARQERRAKEISWPAHGIL